MWEVDPETRSKLLILQKRDGNNLCCDCGAPSPQWASPKFGIFICLNCAGTHRGLGVHISFVRSVSMDAFKVAEMSRMDKGGNKAWRRFFDEHPLTKAHALTWDDCTISDRYGGEVGEEWKDRLTAKVEGKDYVPPPKERQRQRQQTNKPASSSSSSGGAVVEEDPSSRKAQNEAYFARLAGQNAARSSTLPPSQGGKYTGFGSDLASQETNSNNNNNNTALPGINDFQKDPVAALTKGFGWFSSAVGKGAKTVNDNWVQPAAQKIAESDITTQARMHAAQLGHNIQSGAAGSFNRFVEGPNYNNNNTLLDEDKRDFWDSFGNAAAAGGGSGGGDAGAGAGKPASASAIGTAAMRKGH